MKSLPRYMMSVLKRICGNKSGKRDKDVVLLRIDAECGIQCFLLPGSEWTLILLLNLNTNDMEQPRAHNSSVSRHLRLMSGLDHCLYRSSS